MSDPGATQTAIAELIARLRGAEIDWDAENVADLMWLSRYVDGEPAQQRASVPPPDPSTPLRRQVDSSPPPAPPPEPTVGLYSNQPQRQTQKPAPAKGGIPFQAPTAPALRKTLALGRSLRPLMRKVDSYTQQVLDEEATAEQTAERRFCMTVVRPAKERWLEVVLVVEDSAASFLWQETIRDFKQVLERQGAFRSITVWHLQTTQGELKLFSRPPSKVNQQSPRSPKELIDASGRRLILLLSDCISSVWHTGAIHNFCLKEWAAHGPLAIVQLLPGTLWSRTVLSAGLEVDLGAWMPGVPNQQLLFREPPIGAEQTDGEGLKLPVITLEPNSLAQWARMVAGWGEGWAIGIWFDEGWQTLQLPSENLEALDAEQLVQRFITTASETAKRLAGLMALVPVNLPIIYLLQETMLPESTPLHLAEIFMSGLIERETDADGRAEANANDKSPTYEFAEGVREPLLDSVPTPLKEEVLDRVSQYIGQKLNRSIYSFTALLQLEQELGETGGSELLKFATLAKQVLQRMGGDYAALVNLLEQPGPPGPTSGLPGPEFPSLRTIHFMQAQVIDEEDIVEPEEDRGWSPFQADIFTVSTFLSHSAADSALALAVAERLGRRGVVAWFDANELSEMGSLEEMLKQAVQRQSTLTLFLSEASLNSAWCNDELRWAIEAQVGTEHLLPVYLGDPLELVRSHPLLRDRFLNADGDRVDQLGYAGEPDPDAIADKIAATAYRRSIPRDWTEINIVLDQRGSGPRRGLPELPSNIARLQAPTLTFRPNCGPRQPRDLLTGAGWRDMANTLEQSLSNALGNVRGEHRKVRVLGHAQTSLVWAVGCHFDRTTSADLYGYDSKGTAITNQGQIRHTALSGGNADRATLIAGSNGNPREHQPSVALGVGSTRYVPDVQRAVPDLPLYWIESGFIEDSEQAMALVTDIVVSAERLRRDYDARELVLFWTTANHVALLAAANLTTHVIPRVKFMEWDHAQGRYTPLPMPYDPEDEADSSPDLEPFEFTVATLRPQFGQQQRNRKQSQPVTEWEIHREQRQAYRWIETLPGDIPLEVVAIPGGTFLMGSSKNESGHNARESPQHKVTVAPFFMGKYLVTQAQWRFVAGLEQLNRELDPDPSRYKGDNRPVEQVSWYKAVEFCDRLSRYTGRDYRLPTEAEWEYACRADTTTPFHFGETITTELANYRGIDRKIGDTIYSGNYGTGPKGESREETTPVNHFDVANAFGLVDMHGNVWEWCQDHWHDSYDSAPEDGSAWVSENEGASRVIRGGSWYFLPRNCRSAYRKSDNPDDRNYGIGFRVVCGAPGTL